MDFVTCSTPPGSLRIRLLEGVDLNDEATHASQEQNVNGKACDEKMVFIRLSLLDESDSEIASFSSQSHQLAGGMIDLFGEEFLFEQAFPTHSLRISSFCGFHASPTLGGERCLSDIILPLNRLEENVSVAQWYQLSPPLRRNESIKSAIKFEVCFIALEGQCGKAIESTYGDNSTPVGDMKNCRDSEVSCQNRIINEEGASSKASKETRPSFQVIAEEALSSSACHHFERSTTYEFGDAIDCTQLNGIDTNDTSPGDDIPRLRAGIIQHAALMGPSYFDFLRGMKTENDNGLSGGKEFDFPADYNDVCLWDQYPYCSSLGAIDNLPEKIEWFAFPDGAHKIESQNRPEPSCSSFILHSDTNQKDIYYCICLTFYIRDFRYILCNDEEHGKESDLIPSGDDSIEKAGIWYSVGLCILTRYPFVQELSRLLDDMYINLLQFIMQRHEEQSCLNRASDLSILQLKLPLTSILAALSFDVPAPLHGCLGVTVNLPEVASLPRRSSRSICFSLNELESFPQCAYSFHECINLIGPRLLLDILYHAFSEHKILLHSYNASSLPMICECIRCLLYPLQWCNVFVPIVPRLLLDLIEAPVPFFIGISTKFVSLVDPEVLRSVVCVDCNIGSITSPRLDEPCSFPMSLDRWCVLALRNAPFCDMEGKISSSQGDEFCCQHTYQSNYLYQSIVFDCMLSMLSFLPDCVFNIATGSPLLNKEKFLEGSSPASARDFLSGISKTQAFHRMISNIHKPELAMFVQSAVKLREFYVPSNDKSSSSRGGSNFSAKMFPVEESRFHGASGDVLCQKRLSPPFDCEPSDDKCDSVFPHWLPQEDDLNLNVQEVISSVLRRFKVTPEDISTTMKVPSVAIDVSYAGLQEEIALDSSPTTVVFPPARFSTANERPLRDCARHWRVNKLIRKLKDHYNSIKGDSNHQRHMWKELFHRLSICKANLKKSAPAPPPSPRGSSLRRRQSDFLLESEDIDCLILTILPLRQSSSILDEEIISKLQMLSFSNDQDASSQKGMFVHGDARRRVVSVLKAYAEQLAMTAYSFDVYSKKAQKSSQESMLLPEKRNCSIVEILPVELHIVAFGYLHHLVKLLLQACAKFNDYLTAYAVLEIAGYYYNVQRQDEGSSSTNEALPSRDNTSPSSPIAHSSLGEGHAIESNFDVSVVSLRSRICHGSLFSDISLWQIVMNEVMSTCQRVEVEEQTKSPEGTHEGKERQYEALQPVVLHMIECNVPIEGIKTLLQTTLENFDIANDVEKRELMERISQLWRIGKDHITLDCSPRHSCSSNANALREFLHKSEIGECKSPLLFATKKFKPQSDFDSMESPLAAPLMATNESTFSCDHDPLLTTDEEDDKNYETFQAKSKEDCDHLLHGMISAKNVKLMFAGQPRHESSLGSTYPKQVTSMHSAVITCIDMARSEYNYVLNSEASKSECTSVTSLAVSHHLISGDIKGNVYVTNWSSCSSRTALLGKNKHPSSVVSVKGLPHDYIASACSSGELRIWNLPPRDIQSSAMNSPGNVIRSSQAKQAQVTHRPFASLSMNKRRIVCMALAESYPERFDCNADNQSESSECLDRSSWLLSICGVGGGVMVYHGDSRVANLSSGVPVLCVHSQDDSAISSMHLVGNLHQRSGISSFNCRLSKSDDHSMNYQLKRSIRSRIQSLLISRLPQNEYDLKSSGCLYTGSTRGQVSVYDVENASAEASSSADPCVFCSPQRSSHSALVSKVLPVPLSGEKNIVSGGYDRLVKYWDSRMQQDGGCCLDLTGATGPITHLLVDQTNHHKVLGVSADNLLRFWDLRKPSSQPYLCVRTGHVDRICEFMQAGNMLVTASRDGDLRTWNATTGECVQTIDSKTTCVVDGCFESLSKKKTKQCTISCACLLPTEIDADIFARCRASSPGKGIERSKQLGMVGELATLVTGEYGGAVKVWTADYHSF